MVSLDRRSSVLLRVFGDGDLSETRLPFPPDVTYTELGTALDEADHLAVVVGTNSGTAELIVIDPANPGAAKPRPLWSRCRGCHDFRVVGSNDGFVVAALAGGGAVLLAAFNGQSSQSYSIGGGAIGGDDELLELWPGRDGGIELFWNTTNGVVSSILPPHPISALLAADLAAWLRELLPDAAPARAGELREHRGVAH